MLGFSLKIFCILSSACRCRAGFFKSSSRKKIFSRLPTVSQTIQIQEGKTVSLTFKNQPKGGIIIQKRDSISGQPLPGAEFRVTTAAGCEVGLDGVIGTSTLTQNGLFTTDSSGEIRISNLAPGAYVLTETKAPTGYVMDAPSTNVVIGANGDTQTVIITNTPKATLTITKRDAVTRKPLANAEFIVRDSEGHAVGPTKKVDLLILDEWLIRPLSPQESYDLLEIVEARCQRSMIFCTQYQSEGWYTRIDPNPDSGSPVSEAIMDRIIHNAYEVLVEGRVSMRERNGLKSSHAKGAEQDA